MTKKTDVLGLHRIKNNDVKRNVFDLSSQKFATQPIGEILPVFVEEVMPNDRISIKANSFTRTAPLSTTAFASFSHEVKFFFVPYSQLWRYFRPTIIGTSMNNLQGRSDSYMASDFESPVLGNTSLPYFSRNTLSKAIFEAAKDGRVISSTYQRAVGMAKLAEALGYGTYSSVLDPSHWSKNSDGSYSWLDDQGIDSVAYDANIALSPFRYLAYQKICYDYFRIRQWQLNAANKYNIDYVLPSSVSSFESQFSSFVNQGKISSQNNTIFCDINQCCLPLSVFTGALPKPQFGSVASAKVSIGSISLGNPSFNTSASPVSSQPVYAQAVASEQKFIIGSNQVTSVNSSNVDLVNGGVDVNNLRNAFALQRYNEITGSNDTDYISQIEAHFGFRPKVESTKCTFIGGFSDELNVSTVVNNNLSDDNSTVLGGLIQSGSNGSIDFFAPDYGIVIGVSTFVPQFSYPAVNIDRRNTYTDSSDFPVPELDSIGMQELRAFELDATPSTLDYYGKSSSVGYVPRYFEWKIANNHHIGYFNFALNNQVLGLSSVKLASYDIDDRFDYGFVSRWLMCLPEYADNIFTNNRHELLSDDNFYSAYNFNVAVVRSLSVYGLPESN